MNVADIEEKLAAMLSPKRFSHSQRVCQTAAFLAEKFGADREKAVLAGILHDCAREFSAKKLLKITETFAIATSDVDKLQPVLLHAPVGAHVAKETFAVSDQEVLQAISCHTVGGKDMSLLDKIIYLADFIEPGRKCPGAMALREVLMSENDGGTVDKAMLQAYDSTIGYTLSKKDLLHPATVEGRNDLLLRKMGS